MSVGDLRRVSDTARRRRVCSDSAGLIEEQGAPTTRG